MSAVNTPTRGTTAHKDWVVETLGSFADEIGKDILSTRRDEFVDWTAAQGIPLTTRDLEILGGFARVKQYAADELANGHAPTREELGQSRSIQHRNTHRRALERQVGDVQYITTNLYEALASAVKENPPKISKLSKPPVKWQVSTNKEIVLHVSDTHFGQCVDSNEVYAGKYDWVHAARRMAYLVQTVSRHGNKDTALRLVFNGDLIEGKIHDDDRGVDMMAAQIDGARQIITAMIDYVRHHFARVEVICQSGNHERWPFRGPGRPTAQKYDSATTTIMRGVEQIFRSCDDVRFSIPLTPFSVWESNGWRFLATHGDDVFQISNPSKGVKLDALFTKLYHMEAGGVFGGKINAVMIGHWHFPMVCRVPSLKPQPWLTINGCASGKTAYTQTIGIGASSPVQTFWEVTHECPMQNFQMVDLDSADNDESLEQIVPVPVGLGTTLPKISSATDFYAITGAILRRK